MSNSPLVSFTQISPNKTSPRTHKIDTITIHCYVGQVTVERIGKGFANPDRHASCNYGIGKDGRIALIVDEADRSWCSSSSANDHRAITIEVASDNFAPYAVTDAAYAALIDLLVDICKRNGIKKLLWKADKNLIGQPTKQNMTVHRWFAAKSCPGAYLYDRHAQIAEEVNKRLTAAKGDVNEDGKIDEADMSALLNVLAGAEEWANADVNGDGVVNKKDALALQKMIAGKSIWRVQVGAFLIKKNAEKTLSALKNEGFDGYITKSGLLYRVQVGAFSVKANAEKVVYNLKEHGFSAILKEDKK